MKVMEAAHKLRIADREVPENTVDLIPVSNKLKAWAAKNAYTLVFLSVMFGITWLIMLLSSYQIIRKTP